MTEIPDPVHPPRPLVAKAAVPVQLVLAGLLELAVSAMIAPELGKLGVPAWPAALLMLPLWVAGLVGPVATKRAVDRWKAAAAPTAAASVG